MVPTIAALSAQDEYLNHQIANTFAVVGEADHSWTEKVWFTLFRKSGGLQANFGLGKYANRNVMDGFAGVQHGTTQRTIRASRAIRDGRDEMAVGPLRYEVIEPLKTLRITVTENTAQPIAMDLTWTAHLPAFFEDRDFAMVKGRKSSDVVRYHQAGTVSGWIEIAGERIAVNPEDWCGFRDHSWGIREHVGEALGDLPPAAPSGSGTIGALTSDYQFNWLVSHLVRPDGSAYDLAYYFREFREPRGLQWFTGWINEEDGAQKPVLQVYPELTLSKANNAVLGGTIFVLQRGDGRKTVERVFEVEAIDPELGFRLNPAMYGPWKGAIHGAYKGEAFLEGEAIEDVNHPDKFAASRRWEIRDRPLRIREGNAVGYADLESIVIGDWPGITLV
jgi:hypothetical protein